MSPGPAPVLVITSGVVLLMPEPPSQSDNVGIGGNDIGGLDSSPVLHFEKGKFIAPSI